MYIRNKYGIKKPVHLPMNGLKIYGNDILSRKLLQYHLR